jgi:hypothetical protein
MVAELDEAWEGSGETDDDGMMLGVCANCDTREEEQERFDTFAEDYMFEGDSPAGA